MRWVYLVGIMLVILLAYTTNSPRISDSFVDRSIVKKTRENEKMVLAPNVPLGGDSAGLSSSVKLAGRNPNSDQVMDDRLDPLQNPILAEKKKKNQAEKKIFESIVNEKKENLKIQLVGNGEWQLFSDLQVSKDPVGTPLFEVGPFHVFRKEENASEASMGLIVEENQKQLGVLTGRVVVKVRDLYDMNLVARDYGLRVDTVSPEIRTAYLDGSHIAGLSRLNEVLKNDERVERFYFEVVRTAWVKN